MPYRSENRDGLSVLRFFGATSVSESRQPFREIQGKLLAGPAFILIAYEEGCAYLSGPRETLQFHLAANEAIGEMETGAIAFLCHEDALFGICRQFQLLASNARVKLAVFRDGTEAEAWLAAARDGKPDLTECL